MAIPAIHVSLQTLRDLLIEEARFLYGVRTQVEEVETELDSIRSLLMVADESPDIYHPVILRSWIINLEKLASRAEDVLEKYAVEVTSRGDENLKRKLRRFCCILGECLTVHEVGKEIRAIRSNVTKLTESLGSMAPGLSSENHQLEWRATYGHQVEEHFVGMQKDIASLVSLVKDRTRPNRVISIYGMGGLGKTTLARKIYQHKDLLGCFEARAWVCVTQQFQPKTVLGQILRQLLPDERKEQISKMELRELVEELHNFQMQKRCLIVIDDIWETHHWDKILKPAFPILDPNCKVLLTTRNREVASEECLYELHCLTEDEGWDLLRKIALPRELETEESPLEAMGRQMVKKCGRLPLAVSVIGAILREKQTHSEWQRVNKDIDSYLKLGEGAVEKEKVKQVLDLSYNALPYHLKSCFLYLGCFPEDEEIDTERLYLLWMAEGMIPYQESGSETLRDVAERYLNELAVRSMVQVQKHEYSSAYNKFKSCRLHDLVRDLCLSKGEEKGLFKLIGFGKRTKVANSIGTASRLAIHCDGAVDDYINKREKMKNLRSLLLLQKERNRVLKVGYKDSVTDFNKLKRLRILALENGEFVLPNEVGMLIHLRYLSLFNSEVKELPLSVSNLPYLQTLDLRVLDLLKLPNAIFKMKRLRHIFLKLILVTGKRGEMLILDGLKELETLQGLSSYWVRTADIPKLTNLQYLSADIYDNDSLLMIVNHMRNDNCQLRETLLDIWSCDFGSTGVVKIFSEIFMSHSLIRLRVHGHIGFHFPSYEQGFGTNLVDLLLYDSEIEGNLMEMLGKLPMLKFLGFDGKVFVDAEMTCRATSFPRLKCLSLMKMSKLRKWVVEKGAMPNLSSLQIGLCKKLQMIPDGLRFITTLQELSCLFMPKSFNDALRVVNGRPGQDYHKVSHVPFISLEDFD